MSGVHTSMGLILNLSWKGKSQQADGELDTKKLVELLNRDIEILSDEDRRKVTANFRTKVSSARRYATENDQSVSYAALSGTLWISAIGLNSLFLFKDGVKRKKSYQFRVQ